MKPKEKPTPAFNLKVFLTKAHGKTKRADYAENAVIFSQGDPADAVFYIHKGKVKLTVLSRQGKEAVVAILGAGDFFGEGCLAGQPLRMGTVRLDVRVLNHEVGEVGRDSCASRTAELFGSVCRPFALSQHSDRRGSGGPIVQFQREAAGTGASLAGEFREGRHATNGHSER